MPFPPFVSNPATPGLGFLVGRGDLGLAVRFFHLDILGIDLLHIEFGTPPVGDSDQQYVDTQFPLRVGFEYPVDDQLITHPLPVRD